MVAHQTNEFLRWAQLRLEDFYGAKTGLDVRDFVQALPEHPSLGSLHIQQDINEGDIDLALYLDRDIFSAWQSSLEIEKRKISVLLEETSHFVYLGFNHQRRRNITQLEMELQSEVDRIVLLFAVSDKPQLLNVYADLLLKELHENPYFADQNKNLYEEARKLASLFLRRLNVDGPQRWSPRDAQILRKFFHLDLAEKIHLLRQIGEGS